jgi:hypothetical protein
MFMMYILIEELPTAVAPGVPKGGTLLLMGVG